MKRIRDIRDYLILSDLSVLRGCLIFLMFSLLTSRISYAYVIEDITQVAMPGGATQIEIALDRPVDFVPQSFSINKPARVSFDFPNTTIKNKKNYQYDSGIVTTVRAVEANDKARLVVSLRAMVPYDVRTSSNVIYINFDKNAAGGNEFKVVDGILINDKRISSIDFRRGSDGEGKVTLSLSDPSIIINLEELGNKLQLDVVNAQLPEKLVRRLDVIDFATPITTVDAFNSGLGSKIVISTSDNYEHMAYQTGQSFIIDVKPISEAEIAEKKKNEFGYSGEPLSLNFQNIEVRAVLQLLADFTGMNVVASDTVQGNITLRLKNVPWDQALDIILKTRGLGMRKTGNVMLIAPNDELMNREKAELEAEKQKLDLAPLKTSYFQINYAKAADIASMLKAEANTILTERGHVTVDERTNTLMVLETAEKHEEIASLIEKLDIPIRQVMIESRIVVANDDFGRDIGIRAGVTSARTNGSNGVTAVTGSAAGADTMIQSAINNNLAGTGPYPIAVPAQTERYNVNLPATGGRLALAILGADYLVDLELSALQTEGRGEVLSNPRVITSNQKSASIEQGVEIPYQESSSSGATSTAFKKAVLSLNVTPQITPDDRVVMDLTVNKDSVGGIYSGIPSINTRSITTQVLVDNGDTVVLGGVYEQSVSEGETKVPLLGDIPLIGMLFRSKSRKESKQELLIFVTPKILSDKMSAGL
ncbi:MAG: type IV pilus secretin PilQ [Chromatiales bacterium]|nr:type IV pilus secretin PilQ [Chromatiales bacterium]